VVAQFDPARAGAPTRRYYLSRDGALEEDAIDPPLGETNTGDARDLARFLAWGMAAYPADRYALVLWNHGIGWRDATGSQGSVGGGGPPGRGKRPLFRAPAESIVARGIAWDATSQDFLDNAEIRRALDAALLLSRLDRLDVLALDACLMQMLEVAYEIKGLARYVVASQEVEPEGGWPYTTLLRRLSAWPDADGAQLGAMAIDAYLRDGRAGDALTLSVLDLDRIGDVTTALDALCRAILDNLPVARPFVLGAARAAQRYRDPDCRDLYDVARLIWDHTADTALRARARDLMALLEAPGADRFVVAEGHRGAGVARSHGVSIYLPDGALSPFYRRLEFARDTLWDEVLRALFGAPAEGGGASRPQAGAVATRAPG